MAPSDETIDESDISAAAVYADTVVVSKSGNEAGVPTPNKIDRYIVEGKLGEGGMGVVLAARDPDLDRPVALKLIKPSSSGSSAKARLLREAQSMAKLSHPNVVAVFDVGTHAGDVFVAMEHIQGPTLRAWLEAEERDWDQMWPVFRDAARGLEAAHNAGIIHRDFKPANVLLDNGGRAQVTDFGLARAVADDESGQHASALAESDAVISQTITTTGAVMGTPRYMSPEQHSGQRVDTKTDQFSYCVALYEALYGEPPFAGASSRELALAVTHGVVRDAPTRKTKHGQVSTALRNVLLRGLSKDRRDRFPSMAALIDALEPPARSQLGRWVVGIGLVVAASAALTLLVPRGGVDKANSSSTMCKDTAAKMQALWSDARKDKIRTSFAKVKLKPKTFATAAKVLDTYAQSWIASRTDACTATNVRGEQSPALMDRRMSCLDQRLAGMSQLLDLMQSDDAKLVARAAGVAKRLSPIKDCNDTVRLSLEGAAIAPELRAQAGVLRGEMQQHRVLLFAGRLKQALAAQKAALKRATELGIGPVRASLIARIGETYLLMGKLKDAESQFRAAIKLAEAVRDDITRANAMTRLAHMVGYIQRRFAEGLSLLELAEAAVKRTKATGGLARIYATRGFILDQKGDLLGAIKAHRKAVKHSELTNGKNHPIVARRLNNLVRVLTDADKTDEALDVALRAQAITTKAYGPTHIRVAVGNFYLGGVYSRLGRHKQAIAAYEHTIRVASELQGPNSRYISAAETNLGGVYNDMNRYGQAVVHYKRGLAVCAVLHGKDHMQCAMGIFNVGTALDALGRTEEAGRALTRALAIRTKALKPNHPDVGLSHLGLGDFYRRQGQLDKALSSFELGLAIYKKSNGPEHSMVAQILLSIGKVHRAAKRFGKALAMLDAALVIARKRKSYREHVLIEIGDIHRENTSDCTKAVAAYQQAIALYDTRKKPAAEKSDAVYGLGRCAVASGQYKKAVPLFRQVVAARLPSKRPGWISAGRFQLAIALWHDKGSRTNALEEANRARAEMASVGKRRAKALAQIERWLATHTL